MKAKKLARAITSSEFETDIEEWQKICAANKGVRLLEAVKSSSNRIIHFTMTTAQVYRTKLDKSQQADSIFCKRAHTQPVMLTSYGGSNK
jgi:hypothetical protein